MSNSNALQVLKPCFEKDIPTEDARTAISPLKFIVCLIGVRDFFIPHLPITIYLCALMMSLASCNLDQTFH